MGEVPNLSQLASDLECRQGQLSVTYLGSPLGSNYKQRDMWSLVIDRMRKRLNGWKARYLSKGGLTLIKASLASIPIHYLSLLVLTTHVCKSMEKILRDFLWKGKDDEKGMHLVS